MTVTEVATALILGILTNIMLSKDKDREPVPAAEIPEKKKAATVQNADAPKQPAKQYPQNKNRKKGGKGKKKRK